LVGRVRGADQGVEHGGGSRSWLGRACLVPGGDVASASAGDAAMHGNRLQYPQPAGIDHPEALLSLYGR
jgi:hypothetical protein